MAVAAHTFRDRSAAGSLLGEQLADAAFHGELVLGLPRGGVPVAAQVARALDSPLDVLVVRKLGLPWQPELAFGAVGEDGVEVLNPRISRLVSEDERTGLAGQARAETARRVAAWRGNRPPRDVRGRTVILIDDGVATGASARAAIAVLRARGAARIVLAVPVAAREVVGELRQSCDEVVCLVEPEKLHSVGSWYGDFHQVEDAEVRALLDEARLRSGTTVQEAFVPSRSGDLPAQLTVPAGATGLVLFAHGSRSSRFSPRNRGVAQMLHRVGLATVLMDLLTENEAAQRSLVFDIELLADRLLAATRWAADSDDVGGLPQGYFGASTGAAAALWAAAERPAGLRAVVSRGGRPDLAGQRLARVTVPTLLVAGGLDRDVLALNRAAQQQLVCRNRLEIVPGATHLFEEPGALEAVGRLAAQWFLEANEPSS
jgi:putative phosphoribosyl transferase